MTGLEIWLLAVGLSMDCFAVSIASGIILKRMQLLPMLFIAFSFGFFQWLMPLIGWAGANLFSHMIANIDHWVAFGILATLGGKMIAESFKKENCKHKYNPADMKVTLAFALATSIDALAVGISFAFTGINDCSGIMPAVGIIGMVSFILSLTGLLLGVKFGCGIARKLKPDLLGGIILVAIGIKILIEHLFFNN